MKLHVGKPPEAPDESDSPARTRWKWPSHLFGGRVRTSTVALIIAYAGVWWVYDTYREEPKPPAAPQVVPPGFIPDPAYTWVPRTKVQLPPATLTPTTTTPTTTEPPPEPEPSETEPPPPSPVPGFPFCPPFCPPPAPDLPELPGQNPALPDTPPSSVPSTAGQPPTRSGAPTPSTQPGPPGSHG